MRTLYHCPRSRSFRVLWALEELRLEYQLITLPFPPRVESKEYLAINPLGTVPFYLDGDVRMTESTAVCQYLAMKYGDGLLALAPDEHGYAQYLNLVSFGEASLMFPLSVYFRYSQLEPTQRRSEQVAEDYRRFFVGRLRHVETTLGSNAEYLCGGRFTVADISVGFALLFAEHRGLADSLSTGAASYLSRLKARPAYHSALEAELRAV